MPRKRMRKYFKEQNKAKAREIYQALSERARSRNEGPIWRDDTFRIDAGHTLRDHPNVRTWNLQLNKEAQSKLATSIRKTSKFGDRGHHTRLFWGAFDFANPPAEGKWIDAFLDALNLLG